MKKSVFAFVSCASILASIPSFAQSKEPVLYQAGALLNLTNGIYTSTTTLRDLTRLGDFGLGTTDGAQGEMVIVNKVAYLADSHGNTHIVSPKTTTPFTMITDFKPSTTYTLTDVNNEEALLQNFDQHVISKNIFYAIKVEGQFNLIKMRDFPPPVNNTPLDQWIKQNQNVSTHTNIAGTLVVFYAPSYLNPVTFAGYHIHFISANHKLVGHVYDVQFKSAKVSMQPMQNFSLMLPDAQNFLQASLKTLDPNVVTQLEKNS